MVLHLAKENPSWGYRRIHGELLVLEDAGRRARFMIRDSDGKFPPVLDVILATPGIQVVLSGIQIPRMNSIMKRWIHHTA